MAQLSGVRAGWRWVPARSGVRAGWRWVAGRSYGSTAAAAEPALAVRGDVPRRHISKLLVANRGEIACRVMRTARRLGVRTVAVYSDADRDALHVHTADEAYRIGPAAAAHSYLSAERVLEAARATGAQAVHPGYGFLSENLEFCTRCREEDIVFVGPPPAAIRDMGIKSTSKRIMAAAGVPVVEGYHGDDQSAERLHAEAQRIGFPLMIKAVRGGGGKGMRIAAHAGEFAAQLESARREALKAFGDDAVLLERYIAEPRHVEVQVFADRHGNAVHLFERDCSVQRRHQKTIEEAPAPGLSESTRSELGAAAVRAALAVGYEGAGTVEFILDRHTHAFHFCEMNTRLQVEHPVTEMITGTDLVEWQLRVASGEPLPRAQASLRRAGHAVECRVYAEEPRSDFMPRAGTLSRLRQPRACEHVRVETGVREGDDVSVHYDPMIAKLVVWAPDRTRALARMHAELGEYQVAGVETNIEFLRALCTAPAFLAGDVHTGFIPQHRALLLPPPHLPRAAALRLALALILMQERRAPRAAPTSARRVRVAAAAWRPNYAPTRTVALQFDGKEVGVEVQMGRAWRARLHGEVEWSAVRAQLSGEGNDLELNSTVDEHSLVAGVALIDFKLYLYEKDGTRCAGTADVPRGRRGARAEAPGEGAGCDEGTAPTQGVLERVLVTQGQQVEAGQPLFVVIAMKMEYTVRARRAGRVAHVAAELLGTPVRRGQGIVRLLQTVSES